MWLGIWPTLVDAILTTITTVSKVKTWQRKDEEPRAEVVLTGETLSP